MGGWPRLGPLQGRPTTTKAPAHGVSSCRVVPTRGGPNSQDCRQQGQQHWPQGRRRSEEGVVGLGMAGRGGTIVLRTSWFNCSSWIHAKEIAAKRVYGCRAFTSPRIFGFRPSIKVEARVVAIVEIAWEGGGMDDGYKSSKIAALIPYDKTPEGAL
ncbi:hypothetical protein BHM03_00000536 [Ensete ventricosum]|nr:hypothetical protein BHM03_00000536 [Ensete ventricosum]